MRLMSRIDDQMMKRIENSLVRIEDEFNEEDRGLNDEEDREWE